MRIGSRHDKMCDAGALPWVYDYTKFDILVFLLSALQNSSVFLLSTKLSGPSIEQHCSKWYLCQNW